MSSLRLTDTTRKVMIQHRRVVFSPGEGLNELIDRMPAVLNPVSLPQTVQCHPTPTEGLEAQTWWRQYFGVAPCLFQSNIHTTPTHGCSLHHISWYVHLLLLYSQEFRRLAARFEFSACCLVGLCTCSVRGCHSWAAALAGKEIQTNCPMLTFMHFGALSLLLPPSILIRGCCQTTVSGMLGEEEWVLWNWCDQQRNHLFLIGNLKHN